MGRMARYLVAAYAHLKSPPNCRVIDAYGPGPFWKMPFYFLWAFLQIAWACTTGQVDVVHLHMSFKGSAVRKLILLHLARLFGVATVLHLHGSEFEVFCNSLPPLFRRALVSSLAAASRVVVIGEFWRRFLVEQLGVPAEKVVIIRNGVPLPPRPTPRPQTNHCRIVVLGRLGVRKGTPEFLQALSDPRLAHFSWDAIVAGDGEVELYRAHAKTLGIANRVTMPGWVGEPQVKEYLASADLFVLPSHNEGLPVAILEAMASGVAVITTPVGAIADLVVDQATGLLVPPGAVTQLANALVSLVGNPSLRAQMGAAGRQRMEDERQFSIEGAAEVLGELYREVGLHRA